MDTMASMVPPIPLPRTDAPRLCTKYDLEFAVVDYFVPQSDRAAREIAQKEGYVNHEGLPPPYDIYLFGSTETGHSVTALVKGFEPTFFVKPPASWWDLPRGALKAKVASIKQDILNAKYIHPFSGLERRILPRFFHDLLVDVTLIYRKDLWGFTNGRQFPFIQVKTRSQTVFNMLRTYFTTLKKDGFALYETNVDPLIRFIHRRDLEPCGWVRLPGGSYRTVDEDIEEDSSAYAASRTSCFVEVQADDVFPVHRNKIAPLLIASFDIECTSSHGDFPLARKDYRKLALDLLNTVRSGVSLTEPEVAKIIMECFYNPVTLGSGHLINQVFTKRPVDAGQLARLATKAAEAIFPILQRAQRDMGEEERGEDGDAGWDSDDEDVDDKGRALTQAAKRDKRLAEIQQALGAYNDEGRWVGILPPVRGDPLIQIGTTYHRFGSDEIIYRHMISLGSCDPIPGAEVECYETEAEVIMAWRDLMIRTDPDVLLGYNVFGFDFAYIWQRALEVGVQASLAIGLGRLSERRTTLLEQKLSSSALGDNILNYIHLDGVACVDVLKVMQRDHRLDSYKLDTVAEIFLGDKKHDLKPKEIFEKYQGSSADRAEIASYCLQDCALVNRLVHKLKILENAVGMGNVCNVPLGYLFLRGQGAKIFSLVVKECRVQKTLVPALRYIQDEEDEEGYEGAIVLEPKTGMYLDDPISVLDYASLYPSSIIARNLSHDCFVTDPSDLERQDYKDQGITFQHVTYDVYEGAGDKKRVVDQKRCTFAQLPNGQKGIIPSILMKLLQARKTTRKKMGYETLVLRDGRVAVGLVEESGGHIVVTNVEGGGVVRDEEEPRVVFAVSDVVSRGPTFDPFEKAVLDALQLAYKITANSLYGQIGARTSPIFWKEIAACTTATGREMIMLAKNFAEERFGGEVVYGDSVMPYTPITLLNDRGEVFVTTMEALDGTWRAYEGFKAGEPGRTHKEQLEPGEGLRVWTHDGWAPIKRVIRHKTTKRIFRVLTHTGLVDVTEDHSLLGPDLQLLKPGDCEVGTQLLHSTPTFAREPCNVARDPCNVDLAYILGVFVGDGSCGVYNTSTGVKGSWAINNQDLDLLHKCRELMVVLEPSLDFKILDTIESSGVYKLCPVSNYTYGAVKGLVERYRKWCYLGDAKIVPQTVLNGGPEVLRAFWKGLFDTDGNRKEYAKAGCLRIDTKNQVTAQGFTLVLQKLGYTVSINTRRDKPNIYRVTYTKSSLRRDPLAIKKLEVLHESYHGYVYDLETESGSFHAGMGSLVLKNTDSIFIKFPNKLPDGTRAKGKAALPLSIATGQAVSRDIKPLLPVPQNLEYEKTFFPFILLSKKRYIGNLYEDDPNAKPKLKSMGVVLKRRDNAPIVKTVYGGIIDILLNKQDLTGAIGFLKTKLDDMVGGRCSLEELVVTKTLRGDYKDPTRIAHKVLAERIGARDPGNKPLVNDRIPYVFVRPASGTVPKLQGDRIEHPDYIREVCLTPDYGYYITHQLQTPVSQLLALCVENLQGYTATYGPDFWTRTEAALRTHSMYANSDKRLQNRMSDLRMRVVEELIFNPFLARLPDYKAKKSLVESVAPKKSSGPTGTESALGLDVKDMLRLILTITETKQIKTKLFVGTAKLLGPDGDDTVLWSGTKEIVKRTKMTKTEAWRIFAEHALRTMYSAYKDQAALHAKGVRITADNLLIRPWLQAIAQKDTLQETMRKAAAAGDMLKLIEARALNAYTVLLACTIPYLLVPAAANRQKKAG